MTALFNRQRQPGRFIDPVDRPWVIGGFAGVAFVIRKGMSKYIDDVYPCDGRMMSLTIRNHGPKIHVIKIYAPTAAQDGLTKDNLLGKTLTR